MNKIFGIVLILLAVVAIPGYAIQGRWFEAGWFMIALVLGWLLLKESKRKKYHQRGDDAC